MKTKNFPGRVDARRRKAIARLEASGKDEITRLNTIAKLTGDAKLIRTKKRRMGKRKATLD